MLESGLKYLKEDPRTSSNLWTDSKVDKVYAIDDVGDKMNIQFGHPNKEDIPQFERYSFYSDRCIGLSPIFNVRFLKNNNFDLINLAHPFEKRVRYFFGTKKELRRRAGDAYGKKLTTTKRESYPELKKNFIMLGDVESAEESEEQPVNELENYVLNRSKELNELVRKDTTNISNWIKLIDFQDEFAKLSKTNTPAPILEKKNFYL